MLILRKSGFIKVNLGDWLYAGALLGTIRRFHRVRSAVFGRSIPQWIQDLTGMLGPFRLVGVLPIYIAILLTPKHFFKRLQVDGKCSSYIGLSPVNLVIQSAAAGVLVLATVSWVGLRLGSPELVKLGLVTNKEALITLLATAASSPLWLPVFVTLVAGISWLLDDEDPRVNQYSILWLFKVIVPYRNCQNCLKTLFTKKLNVTKYFWGSCYMSLALVFLGAVCMSVSALDLTFDNLELEGNIPSWHHDLYSFEAKAFYFSCARLFVCAYDAMLESACDYTTRHLQTACSKCL